MRAWEGDGAVGPTGGASGGALRVRTDGASRGNPGHAGIGVVIERVADGAVVDEIAEYLGRETNNVAEYRALVAGLTRALELGAAAVEVVSDSELMVRQIQGTYQVRNPGLLPLFAQVRSLRGRFPGGFRIGHTLRGGNARADELANAAIDRALGRPGSLAPRAAARAPLAAGAAVGAVASPGEGGAADPGIDVRAEAGRVGPGESRPVGGGLRVVRLGPGQTRVSGWVLVLSGAIEVGGRRVVEGQARRGGVRYRAAGPEDAVLLESDSAE